MSRWDDEGWRDDAGMGDIAPTLEYYEGPHSREAGFSSRFAAPQGGPAGVKTRQKTSEIHQPHFGGIGPYRKPRVQVCGLPFWIPLNPGFTNTANENTTAYSRPVDFDTFIHGSWASFSSALVQLAVKGVSQDWSSEQVPILSVAGNSDKVQPTRWLKYPTFLRAQDTIQANFTAIGALTSAQRWAFMTYAYQSKKHARRLWIEDSMNYWLFLDLSNAALQDFTAPISDPLLIWGISTNVAFGSGITVQFTDERSNFAWSAQQLNTAVFGGIEAQVQPIVYLPKPYYLAPRARIRADFSAASANNRFSLICERILRGAEIDPLSGKPEPRDVRSRATR